MSLIFHQDEPTLPPHLTCTAPGGSTANYNMNYIGEGSRLTYENFIYIVMAATFRDEDQVFDLSSFFDLGCLLGSVDK